MVFKRRDRRPTLTAIRDGLWPRTGWRRAVGYVTLRLRRLPDTPETIGRGMAAGVMAGFTPFYGLHFIVAFVFARIVRGNVLAAITGTFVNNFLTLVPISALCIGIGYFLMGERPEDGLLEELGGLFAEAGRDLWHNAWAAFTPARAHWTGLADFYDRAFLPYLVGGILPGLVCAAVAYAITVPIVRAFQNARRRVLAEKLASLRPPPEE